MAGTMVMHDSMLCISFPVPWYMVRFRYEDLVEQTTWIFPVHFVHVGIMSTPFLPNVEDSEDSDGNHASNLTHIEPSGATNTRVTLCVFIA